MEETQTTDQELQSLPQRRRALTGTVVARSGDKTAQSGLTEFWNKITKNIILESWVSKPSTGNKETYTVKLNYVIRF